MSRIHPGAENFRSSNQDDVVALQFENEKLRNRATELLLETSILREALTHWQTEAEGTARSVPLRNDH